MTQKFLFLDIDGVLNCRQCQGDLQGVGEHHLDFLHFILAETHCQLVLTSSWRLHDGTRQTLRRIFHQHGLPEWIGETPDIVDDRAEEITAWLTRHGQEPFVAVVIDDDPQAGPELPHVHMIVTTMEEGLNAEAAERIVSVFNRQHA